MLLLLFILILSSCLLVLIILELLKPIKKGFFEVLHSKGILARGKALEEIILSLKLILPS